MHAKIRRDRRRAGLPPARSWNGSGTQDVRYQFHVSLLPGRLVKGANEHYDIIEAVIAGDAVAAEQITRDHFMSVIAALRQLEELKTQRPGMAL